MASYLASIYGTEQDKVNCSFYYKIGACRHGDRCSRKHIRPPYSCTLLLSNVYRNPRHHEQDCTITDTELQAQFDTFYEDMFVELAQYGQLVEMHVCDNVGDHLIGNVYARYRYEADAQRAVDALNDRWYDGKPLFAELSPVTDFQEACCRQNETNECNRGGFCNFMHLRYASRPIRKQLNHQLAVELRKRRDEGRDTAKGVKKRLGWKERLALEQGESLADGSDGTASEEADRHEKRDWRSGKSGGDWRSQPRAADVDAGADSNTAAHSISAEADERSRDAA
ncbi:related to splicing factor U2AF 35 kd subunit [Sporisorium reilianum f. sp. reilianum]|uniref:Related to splicing factor U2AF 35 kd subunit n=1 Tax=Sporisorium reilianum f. sp. reilianum TaxID=72559 RepID=A0A2N8UGR6_9BASI|nr:related to splicing factor U2AF 35 kd subunit [Sporisorium reilianum f. sp. reilianum]